MQNKNPVNINDLIGEIEIQLDDTLTYIDTKMGEVISLTREEIRAAEDEVAIDKFPVWQRENIEKAIRIIEDEDEIYVDFTLRNDYNEYVIIEEFVETIMDQSIREGLYEAIQGKGAFRRFKDGILEYGIDKQWYKYKEDKIRELVIEWCNEQGIEVLG